MMVADAALSRPCCRAAIANPNRFAMVPYEEWTGAAEHRPYRAQFRRHRLELRSATRVGPFVRPRSHAGPQHHLLVAMALDQRHPVKAGAHRAPASRLAALTGCRPARQEFAMRVRRAKRAHRYPSLLDGAGAFSIVRCKRVLALFPSCLLRWWLFSQVSFSNLEGVDGKSCAT